MTRSNAQRSPHRDLAATMAAALIALACVAAPADAVDLAAAPSVPEQDIPIAVALADVDGNRTQDMVAANYNRGSVTVRMGDGAGNFGAAAEYPTQTNPNAVALAPLDGDTLPDMAVANFSSASVTVRRADVGGRFGRASHFEAGAGPSAVELADLDADGRRDMIVANFHAGTITRRMGDGAGGFGAAASFAVGTYPNSIGVGDFDGDGKVDLAVVNHYEQHGVSVLLGDGAGDFAPARHFPAGRQGFHVAVGRFNGDRVPDLAVTNYTASEISVLIGRGDGGFEPPARIPVGGAPAGIVADDVDGDGLTDLAFAEQDSDGVAVLVGRGDGRFRSRTTFAAGRGPVSLARADLDRDGMPDLAAANTYSHDVSVFLNRTKRLRADHFAAPVNFAAGDTPDSIVSGDFNSDAFADVAVPNVDSDQVSVLLGDGTGALGPAAAYPSGDGPNTIASGDFNRDGVPDLATANGSSSDISVLLAAGGGTFGPPTSYSAQTGPSSIAVGDFNRDGSPDLANTNYNAGSSDVSVFLNQGSGSFGSAGAFSSGANPAALAVGDFNEDANPDVVVANQNIGAGVGILFGTGSGSFSDPLLLETDETDSNAVAVGDFDGDQNLDFVVGGLLTGEVTVWLGDGAGGFGERRSYAAGPNPYSIAVADLNGDADQDIAVTTWAGEDGHSVSVLLGEPGGRFGPPVRFRVGSLPVGVAVADFDRDGRLDLAVANTRSDEVSLLLATDPPPPPPPPLPEPVARWTVIATPVRGKVKVRCGSAAARALTGPTEVPLRCRIDSTDGRVQIKAAADTAGATQTGLFFGGAFKVRQAMEKIGKATVLMTTLQMNVRSPFGCRTKRPTEKGHLWARAAGRWRVDGSNGSAITSPAAEALWLTKERCAGTQFRAKDGTVVVHDDKRRKNKRLRKGERYLARK